MTGTVKIHIAIDIQVDEEADTGLTVEAWNAMTGWEREEVVQELWNEAAAADNGGVSVVTEGAAGV